MDQFLVKSVLPPAVRRPVVQTILELYQATGFVTRDLNARNFILKNCCADTDHAVLIDFGVNFLTEPGQLLEALLFYFGSEPRIRSHLDVPLKTGKRLALAWAPETWRHRDSLSDQRLIDSVLNAMGETEGKAFLKEGLQALRPEGSGISQFLNREPYFEYKAELKGLSDSEWYWVRLSWNLYLLEFLKDLETILPADSW